MSPDLTHEPVNELIGKKVRIYTSGDFLTQDHVPDRINIELSEHRVILRIWRG